MREILFRAKRLDNGEWVEGYYAFDTCSVIISDLSSRVLDNGLIEMVNTYSVDPSTLGQFTGLTDKNGKKIFEGDIVKADADCTDYGKTLYCKFQVKYNDTLCAFVFSDEEDLFASDFCLDGKTIIDVEIIGNIHDNPELLEVT